MENIKLIERNGATYALVFRRDLPVENGVKFPTRNEDSLQIGFFEREAGYEVKPHSHKPRSLELKNLAEFLSIEEGKALATIYSEEWETLEEVTLEKGDCIVFLCGGHSLKVLESARIMEVKQGPYIENDKIFKHD